MIEQELSELRERVQRLENKAHPADRGAWRELIGWEEDNAQFQEAMRLGAEWRSQANAEER
jgi:hypothetical protein